MLKTRFVLALFFACVCLAPTLMAAPNVQLYTTFNALPSGGELRGDAYISGNRLRLTDAVGNQNGTFVWQPDRALRALRVKADVLIGGGNGADGMAFSYSDLGGGSFGEFGAGSGLIVRLRTWSGAPPRFEVAYNNTNLISTPMDQANLRLNTFVPLEIYVEPNGACVVKYNYITRYTGTISGWNPQSGWGIALSARTGGSYDNHHVDSLMVSDSIPYLVSLTRIDPTPVIIGDVNVRYRALFSEVVANLGGNDFALTTVSGSPSATIGAAVSNLYTVTESFTGGVGIGTLRENAAIVNNRLRLTPAENSRRGSWAFQPAWPLTAFRVNFDLYIGGGDGADGIGFVYSPGASGNFSGTGFATGLTVHFDTYQNTGETPTRPAIVVRYNDVNLLGVQKALRTGSYVPVTINVSHEGLCTVIHDGTVTHRDVVLPGWNPASDWYMGVGAATGGLNDIHEIDNFQLQSSAYRVQLNNPGGEGTIRLDMNNASVSDLEGANVNPVSRAGDEAYVFDFVAPTVTGVAVETGLTVLVSFSEPMGASVLTASNYIVSGSGKGSLANSPNSAAHVSGNTYRLTWAAGRMFIGGDIIITANNVRDAAGNLIGTPNSGTDAGGGIATPPDSPVVSGVTPTANRRPTWSWEQGAFPGNGNFEYELNNSGVWTPTVTLTFTPAANLDEGANILRVRERDSGGNWSSPGSFTIVIDVTPPNPPVVSGTTPTNAIRPTWSWISGGGDGSGNYRHDLNTSGSWTNTTNTAFTPGFDLVDGPHSLAVQERDALGNWSASGIHVITVDTVRPTSTLTADVAVANPTDLTSIPMTVTFDKPVSGFTDAALALVNASTDAFTPVSSQVYTFNLLPSSQGLFSVQVPDNIATDAAGNVNQGSVLFSRTFESARPTATLASVASNPTNASPIPVVVTFSVPVTGFGVGAIETVNGTVANFAGSGAGYSFDLLPDGQGAVTARVPADVAQDGLGAWNTASNTLSRVYDTIAPTVALASGAPALTNAAVPVTATFSEPVFGFTADGVVATNATVTDFTGADGDSVFAFLLTPSVSEGTVTASVNAGVAIDAAANPNEAAPEAISRSYDGVAPTVVEVLVVDGLSVMVTFSEAMGAGVENPASYAVSGSGLGTLTAHPASVTLLSADVYSLNWNLPHEMRHGGDITVTVANVTDLAGNLMGDPDSRTDTGGALGEAPTALCRDITVYLSSPAVSAADIDNGSSDNVGIASLSVNGATGLSFTCAHIAANPNEALLLVSDAAGNTDTCMATITVVDDIPPVITIPGENPRHLTIGTAYAPPTAVAVDNCDGPVAVALVDDGGLDTNALGEYTLVYEAMDIAGNLAVAELTVIVLESSPILITAMGDTHIVRTLGGSVTFEIEASGGSDALSYQWKRILPDKAINVIPGANAAAYTISPLALEDAGEYFCEVTDGLTTEESDIFTLEVTESQLPAAGLLVMTLTAALAAFSGASRMRRRR